jgi:hypothetical protein
MGGICVISELFRTLIQIQGIEMGEIITNVFLILMSRPVTAVNKSCIVSDPNIGIISENDHKVG